MDIKLKRLTMKSTIGLWSFRLETWFRRVLGFHPLPGCVEKELGEMWSHLKQVVADEVVPKQA